MLGAAHGGEQAVLLGAHVGGEVLLPRKVPFLLVPGGDGVAVHRRLEIWGDDAEGGRNKWNKSSTSRLFKVQVEQQHKVALLTL